MRIEYIKLEIDFEDGNMKHINHEWVKLKTFNQSDSPYRNTNPKDISLPPGYRIDVFAYGLDSPVGMVFSEDGDLYIADSGITSGNPKVLRLFNNRYEIIAENFISPITGISILDGSLYISHKGRISVIQSNGTKQDVISGLPCNGDFALSNVAFGSDGKIYFGQGTMTNSGVVGLDNKWVYDHPLMHDEPGLDIILNGQNYDSNNVFNLKMEKVYTGSFCSYGVTNNPDEVKRGIVKASGSILRANRDGTKLELVAWGFRNPVRLKFDNEFRLLVANRGYDVRGSRPIANAPDELHYLTFGIWYGWPDYSVGEPVTSPRFMPEGGRRPEFLLKDHPNIPPKPFVEFSPHSTIWGFDINYNNRFGPIGDVYIAEYGSLGPTTMGPTAPYAGIGHKISRVDMSMREVSTFASNKTGLPALTIRDTGFGRLADVTFGPDGAMYILDIGISDPYDINRYIPNTGVIWKVTRV